MEQRIETIGKASGKIHEVEKKVIRLEVNNEKLESELGRLMVQVKKMEEVLPS